MLPAAGDRGVLRGRRPVPAERLSAPPAPSDLLAATRATSAAFGFAGVPFASFAARIPQVRDQLELAPSELGLVLLASAAGSMLSLPLAGAVVGRLGSRRTVASMSLLLAAGAVLVAVGYRTGVPTVVAGLFVVGVGTGGWDVAMNVQGAQVEQALERSIMSRFHAAWSLGTVAAALLGAAAVAVGLDVTVHLLVVAALVVAAVPAATRSFLPDPGGHGTGGSARAAWRAWREPRTLLIGLVVLCFAFAEGVGNDWIAVALIDDLDASAAVGTLGFAAFVTAMTLGRWWGPALLDRHGRVPVVRASAGCAVVGLLLFVLGGSVPVAFAGILLWGAGTSLGFPVGMSAGADDPVRAAARVSVVASIGYCAFLTGPPLVGFLAEDVTLLRAVLTVAVALGVAALLADALRAPAPSPQQDPTTAA